ncbi:hypothetical protein WDW89_25325 [Deltaproteobacteria bacterium TL4]
MPNLLDKETIAQVLPEKNHDEIYSQLNIFSELGVNRDIFKINDNGFIEIQLSDSVENFPIENFVKTAIQLNNLKSFENFSSFSVGFNNPSQISATIFEVNCANFVFDRIKYKDIRFAPEFSVKGHIKKPDFIVTLSDDSILICECKSMDSINRAKRSKALKLIKLLDDKLKGILDSSFRIEVSFKNLPRHWNRNFVDQLFGAIGTLLKEQYTEKHIELNCENRQKTWIKLSRIEEPIFFNNILNVANKPKNDNPTLVVGEIPNLKKDIKDIIKDARTQIPEEYNSVIFLYSLNEHYAKQAIAEFIKDNNPGNLLGVISWNESVNIHRNLKCTANIFDYLTS